MKKRYYILLSLSLAFIFAGAVTWGGLAGTGGVTEAVQWKLSSIASRIATKLSTTDVSVGTATGSDALTVSDSAATSSIYISSGGTGLGSSIIMEHNDGSGCTEIKMTDVGMATSSITCPY